MSYTDFNQQHFAQRRLDIRKRRVLIETRKTFNFIALCVTGLLLFFQLMAAFATGSIGIAIMSLVYTPLIYIFYWLYMLPSYISYVRGTEISTAVTILNILTGWTVIGWIILLIWAYSAHSEWDTTYTKNI